MSEDNGRGRGVSVTIKYGKGYEETWAGFTGTVEGVRADLIAYFGVDSASVANLSLSELVVEVTNLAHGKGNVAALMGGTVIPASTQTPAESASTPAAGGDPWASVGVETVGGPGAGAPEGPNPMLARIEECTTADALKRLWAENQAAFADSAVMDAWKARGKALTAT